MVEISEQASKSGALRLVLLTTGAATAGTGLFGIAFGFSWADPTMKLFASNEILQIFELAVPFLPIFLIALGAYLVVKSKQ